MFYSLFVTCCLLYGTLVLVIGFDGVLVIVGLWAVSWFDLGCCLLIRLVFSCGLRCCFVTWWFVVYSLVFGFVGVYCGGNLFWFVVYL